MMRPFFTTLCNSKSKVVVLFALGVLLIGGLRTWRLWQPEEQIRLHQRHLLDAVESKNRARLASFLASDFHDAYGHDKEWLLERTAEVTHYFFTLTFREEDAWVSPGEAADRAESSALLRMDGRGTAIAQAVIDTVNRSQTPVRFFWRKPGWKPWHWELVSLEHPLLERAD